MKRSIIGVLLLVVLAISLTGCQRLASTQPAEMATPEIALATNLPFPVSGTQESNPIGEIFSATETAQAMLTPGAEGGEGDAAADTTEEPTPTATLDVTATKTPIATATPGVPTTWTLQSGEWPICIARRYNLDIGDLLSLNGMTMESRPSAGTVLTLPQNSSWSAEYGSPALQPHPATYTVSAGDTLYSIACKYGDVSPDAIIAANGLEEPVVLSAGQTLDIP